MLNFTPLQYFKTRNAAVVGRRTTAVYAAIHYLKCAQITKVGQGHQKLLLVQRFRYTYQTSKDEVYIQPAEVQRCSGSRNTAKFRAVPEIRG